jgi:PPE-repeat protein
VDFAVLPPEINSARMYAAAGAGPMVAAAASFAAWMSAAAAQDERTASQLSSAIAAYDATFLATMPPVEIEVNRALMSRLLATNLFGQNASLIAATEMQYADMWAQDPAATHGYAGASAAATRPTPFNAPGSKATYG